MQDQRVMWVPLVLPDRLERLVTVCLDQRVIEVTQDRPDHLGLKVKDFLVQWVCLVYQVHQVSPALKALVFLDQRETLDSGVCLVCQDHLVKDCRDHWVTWEDQVLQDHKDPQGKAFRDPKVIRGLLE